MTDFEWCCDQVLGIVNRSGPDGTGWEDFIVRFLAATKRRSSWEDRPTWIEREPKDRTTIIYYAIEHLIQKKRIHAAPEYEQATGRRLLRPTNILDSIVESL